MSKILNPENFRNLINQFYLENRREFAWRVAQADGSFDPYKILVSEIMLQQTQTSRVEPYYERFLSHFPTVSDLAQTSLQDVLTAWQGLGYNRRARYLRDASIHIVENLGGVIPQSVDELVMLPGVGKNTAGAIVVYAYNRPEIFIETNIRTVYIHEFFDQRLDPVHDNEIIRLLEETIDPNNPRDFYWALMDYGAYLKSQGLSQNTRSKHYNKQTKFEGSARQLRGKVLRLLALQPMHINEIQNELNDKRIDMVLGSLTSDKLIEQDRDRYFIAQ